MSRTINSTLIVMAALAALAPSALAPSAQAGTAGKSATVRVAYADLDTTTMAGGAMLLERIERAARTVCGKRSDYSQLTPHAASNCRHTTAASIVSQLGIEKLTLAYARANPTPVQVALR